MDRPAFAESEIGHDLVGPRGNIEPEGCQCEVEAPSGQDIVASSLRSQTTSANLDAGQRSVSEVDAQFAAYRRYTQKRLTDTREELSSVQSELASKSAELLRAHELASELDRAKAEVQELQEEKAQLVDELDLTKRGLSSARQMLVEARRQGQEERTATKERLSAISQRLSDAEAYLAATQTELSNSRNELTAAKSELLAARTQLMSARNDLAAISEESQARDTLIHELQASIAQLRTELERSTEDDTRPNQQVADLERQLNEARRRFSVAHLEGSKQKARADGLQREVTELQQQRVEYATRRSNEVKDAKWMMSRDMGSPAYRERTPPPYMPRLPTLTSPMRVLGDIYTHVGSV